MISTQAYDRHVEQIFEVLERVAVALRQAGIEYRVVGGLAVFLHVSGNDPMAARMTRDIDLAVDRRDLDAIGKAARFFGLELRHAAGMDMLVDVAAPGARSTAQLVFVREKVRPTTWNRCPGSRRRSRPRPACCWRRWPTWCA